MSRLAPFGCPFLEASAWKTQPRSPPSPAFLLCSASLPGDGEVGDRAALLPDGLRGGGARLPCRPLCFVRQEANLVHLLRPEAERTHVILMGLLTWPLPLETYIRSAWPTVAGTGDETAIKTKVLVLMEATFSWGKTNPK